MGLLGSIRNFFWAAGADPAPEPIDKAAPSQTSGSDGVVSYGGYLYDGERNPDLTGQRKWTTYTNTINQNVVAVGTRYFTNLLAGTTWHAEPNPAGGADGERGADIVQQGLIDAQMPKPWSNVVKKTSMYRLYGHAFHEWATRTRNDGMVVFAKIEHRPQSTVIRWDKDDEFRPFQGIWQRTRSGRELAIDRSQLFYAVDDTLTDSPDGIGLLRHVVELARRLEVMQRLELAAYQTDLSGTPIGRVPSGELGGTEEERKRKTESFAKFIENRVRHPDILQWFLLDSATYRGADPNTISQIQKWAVEFLRSETPNLPGINTVIGRLQLEIARVLGIEFALVGGGDSAGTYGMHEDKTSMFATTLQATLNEIAAFATNDLARVLVALNGLDPETCTPRLVAEPISTEAIEVVTKALVNIQLAGLLRNDPARDVLRRRMRLPPEPEPTAEELAMLPRTEGPAGDALGGDIGGAGAGADVPVNDLGDTSPDAPTNAPAKPGAKPAPVPPPRKEQR